MNRENRRSVRTYDGKRITDPDREKLQQLIDAATNPYDIPIEYRFLEPDQYGLKSPVLSGEMLYLAGKPLSEKSRERFGKALEHVRWAPSAVNKQPWRMIVKDETVFFYEKPDRGFVRLKAHKCRQVIYPAYGKGVRRRFGHWQTGDK